MDESEEYINFRVNLKSFGSIIAMIREQLNLTQEELGELLFISRVTLLKIEKINDINEISNDMLFRFHYLFYTISMNKNLDEAIRFNSKKMLEIVDFTLMNRIPNDKKLKKIKLLGFTSK